VESWSIAKYQIPSTKPGPRPEGGDSEGEISGCKVSGKKNKKLGSFNSAIRNSKFEIITCKVSLFHPQRIRAEISHHLPLPAIAVLPQEAQFRLLRLLEYLPYHTRE